MSSTNPNQIPRTNVIKVDADFVEVAGDGIMFEDNVTYESSAWTYGGGETVLNLDKPKVL